jgi:hypothetical protein
MKKLFTLLSIAIALPLSGFAGLRYNDDFYFYSQESQDLLEQQQEYLYQQQWYQYLEQQQSYIDGYLNGDNLYDYGY